MHKHVKKKKIYKHTLYKLVGDLGWGGPEGSLFNSYYTEV